MTEDERMIRCSQIILSSRPVHRVRNLGLRRSGNARTPVAGDAGPLARARW